jgi:glucose-6-phosphate 1-dehydrogenase
LLTNGGAGELSLLGSGAQQWDDEGWRQTVTDSFATVDAQGPQAAKVARDTRYLRADVTQEEDLRRLLDACQGRAVIYFALPPAVTVQACSVLMRIGVPAGTRLVLE